MRRRPEPVLVERVARHRQRVVDPDRLAGDLLPVLVDGEIGREVGRGAGLEAGRREVEIPDQQQPGRPDRLDGQRLPLGDDETLLVPEPRRRRRRDEEQDQPEVGEQRRHLGVLVAVAVHEPRPVRVGRLAHAEARPPQDAPDVVGRHAAHRRAIGQTRVEVRLGLGDADIGDPAPQPRCPVQRADDDRRDEHDEAER